MELVHSISVAVAVAGIFVVVIEYAIRHFSSRSSVRRLWQGQSSRDQGEQTAFEPHNAEDDSDCSELNGRGNLAFVQSRETGQGQPLAMSCVGADRAEGCGGMLFLPQVLCGRCRM